MPAEARSAIAQPDFSQIFASAAYIGELLNWPSEDYLRGWGYLQPQEAPPMEYFNAFYNGTDTKLLYLFTAANIRKNSTAYQVDDILTSSFTIPKELRQNIIELIEYNCTGGKMVRGLFTVYCTYAMCKAWDEEMKKQ